jgi:purine-nucleoside phosphorylase
MSTLKTKIAAAVKAVRKHAKGFEPKVGLILGTGLGSLAGSIRKTKSIPFSAIPGFGVSKVKSHAGNLLLGELGGKRVVAMQGRYHWYEGWSLAETTFPVRVMKALGVEVLVVSNACGGMNPNWNVGDLMVIDDHIDMMGDNPLRGDNDDTLGPRFRICRRPTTPRFPTSRSPRHLISASACKRAFMSRSAGRISKPVRNTACFARWGRTSSA